MTVTILLQLQYMNYGTAGMEKQSREFSHLGSTQMIHARNSHDYTLANGDS